MATPDRFERYMAESDAIMWSIEAQPRLRSTITTVLLLDRPPDALRIASGMTRAMRLVPRLRQRPVPVPAHVAPPRWVDAEVDLSYHVQHVRSPAPADLQAVLRLAELAAETPFDRSRPLWELTVIGGLDDDRAAVILKIHHAVTDGVGGMRILALVLDLERDVPLEAEGDPLEIEHLGRMRLTLEALDDQGHRVAAAAAGATTAAPLGAFRALSGALRDPVGSATGALALGASLVRLLRPVTETMSPIMRRRSLARRFAVLDVPVESLSAAGHAAGGTLNDAFVAAVAGGLHRYHAHHGVAVPELRMSMPVSIRAASDPLGGNRITPTRFTVPISVVDPVERIRAVGAACRAAVREPGLPFTDAIARGLERLPGPLLTPIFTSMLEHVDFFTTNVPGTPVPLYLAGARVERLYALAPTMGTAVNVALVSWEDRCCVGIAIDTGAVDDPADLVDCVKSAFAEVVALAPDAARAGGARS